MTIVININAYDTNAVAAAAAAAAAIAAVVAVVVVVVASIVATNTLHYRSESGVLAQLVLFTIMIPHSKAMRDGLLDQHATSSERASYGFEGSWAQQHMPRHVKPVDTICLKDGSLADIAVVGEILVTLHCHFAAAVDAGNTKLQMWASIVDWG